MAGGTYQAYPVGVTRGYHAATAKGMALHYRPEARWKAKTRQTEPAKPAERGGS